MAVGGLGCAPKPSEAEAAKSSAQAKVACPALRQAEGSGALDLATLFGIDVQLAARVERTLALAAEIEETARELDRESRSVCMALAHDLDPNDQGSTPLPEGQHPCALSAARLAALRQSEGLALRISAASCAPSRAELAQCAGECLTGRRDVESAVTFSSAGPDAQASFDFELPDAPAECRSRCAVRALRQAECRVEIEITGGARLGDAKLTALRRDLSRLVALGVSLGPRAIELGKQIDALIDELAGSIDALTQSPAPRANTSAAAALDTRWVGAAVLAGCVAPGLADTLRAGATLASSVEGAMTLHRALPVQR